MRISGRKSFAYVGSAILVMLLLLCFFVAEVHATVEFTQTYSFGAVAQARSMCQTNDGGYLLVGQTQSTTSSPTQALVIRVNSAGIMIWNKTFGGTNTSLLLAVAQTADLGFALAGTLNITNEEFWLFKIDSSGNVLWEKTFGGANDEELYAMTLTNDGGYLLTGWTTSFGSQGQDLWMVKTYGNGTEQWNRRYGTPGNDCGFGIVQTADGGYALTGQTNNSYCWLVKTDSSGLMQWNRTLGSDQLVTRGQKLVQTDDLGYAICGFANASLNSNYDFYFAKTNSSGNLQWSRTYGWANAEFGRTIVKTNDGGYALAGYTESNSSGPQDAWFLKIDPDGDPQWAHILGGTGTDITNSLIRTTDGGFALAGSSSSYNPTRSFYLVKLASSPNFSLTTNSATVPVDQLINLTGTLAVPKTGTVTLEWSIGSSGFLYHSNETISNGVFSRNFGFGQTGTWQFRVNWPGDAATSPATSNAVTVTVNPLIPELPPSAVLSLLVAFALLISTLCKKISKSNLSVSRSS